jgi:hypothetical protein
MKRPYLIMECTCFVELSVKIPAAKLTMQTLLDTRIKFSFVSKVFAKAFDVPIVSSLEKAFVASLGQQHKVLGQAMLPVYLDKLGKTMLANRLCSVVTCRIT